MSPTPDTAPSQEEIAAFLMTMRARGIRDQRILKVLEQVPRRLFVDDDLQDLAYGDHALPIACGQTISQPYIVALMTDLLDLAPEHHVLEVGAGSGYQAAILSYLADRVVTIERYRTLADLARSRLEKLGRANVTVIHGDGMQGAPEHAPFDRIIVTAASNAVPDALLRQLKPGGVMVLPLGPPQDNQVLTRIVRTDDGVKSEDICGVRFVPLLEGAAKES